MPTKAQFIAAFRAVLLEKYPWAQDAARLERFMAGVADTIHGRAHSWSRDGEAFRETCARLGLSARKMTYAALRALPEA